ncbi:MAG: DUF1385 domain-containing protein, partial [Eubacteriales bacterium]|nr:DUF1385 domain-containing protein [Eubacteriales bacterium]
MKKCNQRNSGIGGQAVLEGVMMRNGEDYAVAVRRSDGSITVKKEKYKGFFADSPLKKIPFIRGIFVFIDSMVLGMRCTDYSASIYAQDDPDEADKDTGSDQAKESEESALEKFLMAAVMVFSFALAIGLFMVLPYFIASRLINLIGNANLLSVFEGVIRIAIFVIYILLISMMKDIRRLFQYHGAEHKCINCLENGHELTVENAAKATRLHKRCGSSFILFVMMVSIVLFFFIRVRNPIARVGIRILLLPVISGISYELIRFAGSSDNPLIALLSKPGLWLQGLTTKEPDEEMIAVAIESVNAVFDWRAYLEKEFGTEYAGEKEAEA